MSELFSRTGSDPESSPRQDASSSGDEEDLKSPGKAEKLSREDEAKRKGKCTARKHKNPTPYGKRQNKERKRNKKGELNLTATVKNVHKEIRRQKSTVQKTSLPLLWPLELEDGEAFADKAYGEQGWSISPRLSFWINCEIKSISSTVAKSWNKAGDNW